MPCMSYEDNWARGSSNNQNNLLLMNNDKLARIACKALTALENGIPLDEVLKDKETATWWKAHKKADEKAAKEREKVEAKEKALKLAKAEAMAKLTPEELDALGLSKKIRPRRI